ncbi:ATP-binding protein [soil metagenome]
MKSGFLDKLIERLDRVEPGEVQAYLGRLVQEKGVFERVFEALEEGVIVLDAAGRITFLNSAACRLLGLERDKALEGTLGDKIRGLDWRKLIARGGGTVSRDLEVFYPDHRYLNFYLAPLTPEGEAELPAEATLGFVMLIRDITQNRKLTEEMVESERISALTMLAAGVAHEIGNPLNSLTIHLQLLDRKLKRADPSLHSRLSEMLGVAQGEIKRLDFIVKQFLAAIRPTTPQLELLDLNEVVRESLRLLELELNDRKIEVTLDLAERLPLMRVDGGQMKQAFYNLIKNAVQAMGTGGELTIVSSADDESLRVSFADTGEGISSEDMSNLFQPYFTTKRSGTGLGLLIVRRIVREHGGEIEIESEEGAGTTTTIHLPLAMRGVRMLEESAAGGSASRRGVIDV